MQEKANERNSKMYLKQKTKPEITPTATLASTHSSNNLHPDVFLQAEKATQSQTKVHELLA